MAALLQRAPYNVPVWVVGDLTLVQLRTILIPEDLPILKRIRPEAPNILPAPSGQGMNSLEIRNRVLGNRYGLFDKVCDHLKKTPKELLIMRVEDLAQAFVDVTKLPIEKFPPDKLRQRVMEYVKSKGK